MKQAWLTVMGMTLLLALTGPAQASTRIYSGGVITQVDLEKRTFTVADTVLHGYDWQMRHAVIKSFKHEIGKSNNVFLLDGRPVTPALALKAGNLCRKVHFKRDGGVAEFFSPDSPLLKPADACLVLGLIAHITNKDGKPDTQPYKQVRLEFRAGRAQRALAAAGDGHPPLFGECSPVDATGLRWEAGKLTGAIKVGTESLTLDGSVSNAAVWGTFQGEAVTGEINGSFDYPVEQFPPALHLVLPAGWGGSPTNAASVTATVSFKDPTTAEVAVHLPGVKVEKAEMALAPGGLKGNFTMAVAAPGFTAGNYTVRLATQGSLGAAAGVGSAILKGTCEVVGEGATVTGKVGMIPVGLWSLGLKP